MPPVPLSPVRRLARTAVLLGMVLPLLAGTVASSAAAADEDPAGGAVGAAEVTTTVPVDEVELPGRARTSLRLGVRGRTARAEPLLVASTATGYTPAQIRAHLGLTGTGAGQTIAIVSAYDAPNVVADLAVFNRTFSLPRRRRSRKVNQSGGGSKLPSANGTWRSRPALDVSGRTSSHPTPHLLLVEASSSAMGNLLAACHRGPREQPGE
jgi:hypothetical protein